MTPTPVYQPCGVARLLSGIFRLSPEAGYKAVGLALCEVCGKAGNDYRWYPFCGEAHWKEVNQPKKVWLICDHCGAGFWRPIWLLIHNTNTTGQAFIVCSRKCQGVIAGTRYGFAAHPENINGGRHSRATEAACANGHPRTPETTAYSPDGKRKRCRVCSSIVSKKVHRKRRAAALRS